MSNKASYLILQVFEGYCVVRERVGVGVDFCHDHNLNEYFYPQGMKSPRLTLLWMQE